MAVVEGVNGVGAFRTMTYHMLKKVTNGRILAITMVMLPFFSAMLVTNDVALLVFVPFIATYYMAYNDVIKLDIILFPKRYKFPDFVENFGYFIYRYEDIAILIDNSIGG